MRFLSVKFLVTISVCLLLFPIAISAQIGEASNPITVLLEPRAGGQAEFTVENVHSSAFSVKLVIPDYGLNGAWAVVRYPYNGTFDSIFSLSFYTSYLRARPHFIFYFDKNNDGLVDELLISNDAHGGDSRWQATDALGVVGWCNASATFSGWANYSNWHSLDFWQNQYGKNRVLGLGVALSYSTAAQDAIGEALYADEMVLNGVTHNLILPPNATPPRPPTPTPSPTPLFTLTPAVPLPNPITVGFDNMGGGLSFFTREKVHSSPCSVKLVIPHNVSSESKAIVLYPYNQTLNTISSLSAYVSYTYAKPILLLYLDRNNDGKADWYLVSDHATTAGNNIWSINTGGSFYGWTESPDKFRNYGVYWKPFDFFRARYGNANVLFLGVGLFYWTVDTETAFPNVPIGPDHFDEPLYVDEIILNGDAYGIKLPPTATFPPDPPPTQTPTFSATPKITPTPSATQTPSQIPTQTPTASPSPANNSTPKPAGSMSASLSELASPVQYENRINFTAKIQGGTAPYTYAWYVDNRLAENSLSPNYTIDSLPLGSHKIHVQVKDANNNTAETPEVIFEILPTSSYPPLPSPTQTPQPTESSAKASAKSNNIELYPFVGTAFGSLIIVGIFLARRKRQKTDPSDH